ncbi:hypothetical protein [Allosaccharopolyspora coralli]|uniref:hypothetical protein n=1 Tax=Allosaccharopolyspora coralli TaxID=2665642 RepID=UPI001E54CD6D|nr:hypothetical protein [Allosaccharopolyspora coralli]
MSDETTVSDGARTSRSAPKRRTDIPLLVAGLCTLTVSAYVFVDGSWDVQWLLALAAVVLGVGMLVASLRPRR